MPEPKGFEYQRVNGSRSTPINSTYYCLGRLADIFLSTVTPKELPEGRHTPQTRLYAKFANINVWHGTANIEQRVLPASFFHHVLLIALEGT